MEKRFLALVLAGVCLLTACSATKMLPSTTDHPTAALPTVTDAPDIVKVNAEGIALVQAVYPVMAQYPTNWDVCDGGDEYAAWQTSRQEREEFYRHDGLDDFYRATVSEYLKNSNGENRIYSPVNLYLALAMLAETTDGNSRAEILSLLGVDSLEELRVQANAVWNANYCDDGILTTTLANSLWLKNGLDYVPETLQNLADYYYASAFSGVPGTPEYDKLLQDWLNEQTGNLLTEQVKDIKMDSETVLALASTLYFKGCWSDSFIQDATAPDTFHGVSGDQTVDFMHQSVTDGRVYFGDGFVAYPKNMDMGGTMWLILPDEDKTVDDILDSGEVLYAMGKHDYSVFKDFDKVNLAMPKFDVDSTMDLVPGLMNLGIQDIFSPIASDFSPLTAQFDELYVSKATHSARVKVDEKGCEAAALTVVMVFKGVPRPGFNEYNLTLDRPFLFALTGLTGDLLFMGVVNRP